MPREIGRLEYAVGVNLDDVDRDLSRGLAGVAKTAAAAWVGFKAVQAGIGSLSDFMGESVSAAGEAQQALAGLTSALRKAGVGGASSAAEHFAQLADQIEGVTGVSSEAIQGAQAVAARFGLTGQRLEGATRAAVDLAAVMGTDVQSAMVMIARSSETGKNALAKYGIEVTKGASEGQRLQEVLAGISAKFGGAAASSVATYEGRVTLLKTAWGNLKEELGGYVTNSSTINGLITAATQHIRDQTAQVGKARQENAGWAASIVETASTVLAGTVSIGGAITQVFAGVVGTVQGVLTMAVAGFWEVFNVLFLSLAKLTAGVSKLAEWMGLDSIQGGVEVLKGSLEDLAGSQQKLRDGAYAWADAGFSAGTKVGESTRQALESISNFVGNAKLAAQVIGQEIPKAGEAGFGGAAGAAEAAAERTIAALQRVRAENEAHLQIEAEATQAREAMIDGLVAKRAQQYEREAELQNAAAASRIQAEEAELAQRSALVQQYTQTAASMFGQMFSSIASGSQSAGQAFKAFLGQALDMVIQWAMKAIMANASVAASGAASSQASIPYVGPILAAAAAASVFAMVRGFLTKFHEGGIVGGPRESMALLERGELVVDAATTRGLLASARAPRRFSRPPAGSSAASAVSVFHDGGLAGGGGAVAGGGALLSIGRVGLQNAEEMTDDQVKRWLMRVGRQAEELHRQGLFLRTAPIGG